MSFHDEILTVRQRKALRLLGPATAKRDFYLASWDQIKRTIQGWVHGL